MEDMKITLLPQKRMVETKGHRRAREILKELGLAPGSHLVVRNGQLVTEDEALAENDEVTIISAISGGR